MIENLGVSDGGILSSNFNAKIAGDFVVKQVPFGFSKRQAHYKLVDPFACFTCILLRI
jgi:hypothetical protein